MDRSRFGQLALTCALVATLGITAPLGAVMAQEPERTSLSLPADAALAADAAIQTVDEPEPLRGELDLEAVAHDSAETIDAMPPEMWVMEELAASLGSDHIGPFEFVRDRVRFDPYEGVLRGAQGTLAARAGNAWDRAILLKTLLDLSDHVTQYALGEVDDETANTLLERALMPAVDPIDDPVPTEVMPMDVDALAGRARRDYALLADALGDRLATLGDGPSDTDAPAAVRPHAWVQLQLPDGTWLDLDPTLPDSAPGDTLVGSTSTTVAVPEAASHQVVIRVVAESLTDGVLSEEVVLEERLDAPIAANRGIWLYFQPEGSGQGRALVDALGETGWLPVLFMQGDTRVGSVFKLGGDSGGSDFFGDALGGASDLAALRLELESHGPRLPTLVSQRVLLDRAPAADRASGTVTADSLTPLPAKGQIPPALASLHHLLVSTGGFDQRRLAVARAAAAVMAGLLLEDPGVADDYRLIDVLLPMAVADRAMVSASERIIASGLSGDASARAFVGRPRVFVVSLGPVLGALEGLEVITDIALDDISIALGPEADLALQARHRLWYGVLQSALETEMTLARAQALDPSGRIVESVSLASSGLWELVAPEQLDEVPATSAALRHSLQRGELAIVRGDVDAGAAFWAIDPRTGATRSVIEPGLRLGRAVGSVGGYRRGTVHNVDPRTGNRIRSATSVRCGGSEYGNTQCLSQVLVATVMSPKFIFALIFIGAGIWQHASD